MYNHIAICREWIAKPNTRRYPGLKEKESDRKYTPIIADAKKSLNKAQAKIELGNKWIFTLNKMVNSLKHRSTLMDKKGNGRHLDGCKEYSRGFNLRK